MSGEGKHGGCGDARPKRRMKADWNRARILYELHLRGLTFRSLSLRHGLAHNSLWTATRKRWLRGERIIAEAIGRRPEEIWPSRYAGGERVR